MFSQKFQLTKFYLELAFQNVFFTINFFYGNIYKEVMWKSRFPQILKILKRKKDETQKWNYQFASLQN